jgi:hypothetical protein
MSYAKKQKKWIKKHDVKIGDFVRVIKEVNEIIDNKEDEEELKQQICNSYFCRWIHDGMDNSIGKIFKIIGFSGDGFNSIKLENEWCYSRKSLLKITDLKELAPFYIEIESEEQSKKVQEICFSHGIEWKCSLNQIIHLKSKLIFCYNNELDAYIIKKEFYDVYDCKKFRQLTYDQLLRFEKKQEKKEQPITEQKVNEIIDKKIEELKQQIIEGLNK